MSRIFADIEDDLFSGLPEEEESLFGSDPEDEEFGDVDGASLLLEHYGEDLEELDFSMDGGGLFSSSISASDAESPVPAPSPNRVDGSRVSMARRVRDGASGASGAGYVKGVQDALTSFGLVEPALQARMGVLWGDAATGSPVTLPDSFGALPKGSKARVFDANAAIEADAAELPPVYVADTAGARDRLSAGHHGEVSPPFSIEDRFGDAAVAGYIGSQRRAGARRAAERSVATASSTSAAPSGHGAAFVEDVEASPHLFSDGTILDPVYGKLSPVPCPSCSGCSAEDVEAGHAKDCGICDGNGAVLVPDSDRGMWSSIRYGSLVPLWLGLGLEVANAALDATAGGESAPAPRKVKRRRPSFQWTSSPTDSVSDDVARAVVPERWLDTAATTGTPPSTST